MLFSLFKAVGELRGRQAAGETQDTAPQGFYSVPAGLTVSCLSAEAKRHLFLLRLTGAESIVKGTSFEFFVLGLRYFYLRFSD